jgi:cyclopropane-fatty-acyl-phospholipid synthase
MLVKSGNLSISYRDEPPTALGDGSGEAYAIHINDPSFMRRILPSPELTVGEGYVDGDWDVRKGDLAKVIGLLLVNEEIIAQTLPARAMSAVVQCLASPHKKNDPRHSRRNVAHHYDIGNDLYTAFLDEGMNYSCAFFEHPDQSLRDAQLNKLRTSIRRLEIEPGMAVLDIGSGWGALTRLIAEETGAERVVGITLAEEQCKLARDRIAPGHGNRLSYQLEDYRLHAKSNPSGYDRIVSVGMFEHVGRHHFVDYFRAIVDLLKPGGRALVHSIIRPRPGYTSPWIDKYIFPGGYIPSLGEMTDSAKAAGLRLMTDPFIHESFNYANTLRHWRRRFNESYASLDHSHYDERFRRMWNFYLAGSEAAFDANDFCVAQVLVGKNAA